MTFTEFNPCGVTGQNGEHTNNFIQKMALVFLVLSSCTKQDIGLREQINCHHYRQIINYYAADTTPKIMTIGPAKGYSSYVWYDTDIYDIHIKTSIKDTIISYALYRAQLDSSKEQWFLRCGIPEQPDNWLEQYYIEKDGVRINRTTNYPIITFKPR